MKTLFAHVSLLATQMSNPKALKVVNYILKREEQLSQVYPNDLVLDVKAKFYQNRSRFYNSFVKCSLPAEAGRRADSLAYISLTEREKLAYLEGLACDYFIWGNLKTSIALETLYLIQDVV